MPDVTETKELYYLKGAVDTCRIIFPELFDLAYGMTLPPLYQTTLGLLNGMAILTAALRRVTPKHDESTTIYSLRLQIHILMEPLMKYDGCLSYEEKEEIEQIPAHKKLQFDLDNSFKDWEAFAKLILKTLDDLDHYCRSASKV